MTILAGTEFRETVSRVENLPFRMAGHRPWVRLDAYSVALTEAIRSKPSVHPSSPQPLPQPHKHTNSLETLSREVSMPSSTMPSENDAAATWLKCTRQTTHYSVRRKLYLTPRAPSRKRRSTLLPLATLLQSIWLHLSRPDKQLPDRPQRPHLWNPIYPG
jgi:hypothetical protein